MCGRFAFFQEIEPLLDDIDGVDLTSGEIHARFNIPPTVPIHVVTESVDSETGEIIRALRYARWGVIPPWARDDKGTFATFNARVETLAEKRTFSPLLTKYRAVIPLNGYFEWKTEGSAKQPFFISLDGPEQLYAAGLVSWWRGPQDHASPAASADGRWLLTSTIITKASEGGLKEIHDRTPILFTREGARRWIQHDAFVSGHEAAAWLSEGEFQVPANALTWREVNPAMGNVRVQGPEVLEGQGEES